LKKKDQDMLLRLLSARDAAKRDWLQSFLGGELQQICAWDFHDLNAHVATQSVDGQKL
jgi:predicted RNase H-like nuclease (RuvC/YqgF family)